MNRSAFVLLLAAVWITFVPKQAHAADAAEVLIRKGVDKRRQNDNQGALPLFKEAFDISRSARAAAQLGLCEQALQMWVEAEGHLAEALVSETDPWVASKRGTLAASLAQTRSHMAQLTIVDAPASAVVALSGSTRGKPADGPFYVLPGDVEVSIVNGGQRFNAVERSLRAGEARAITFVDQRPVAANVVSIPNSQSAPESASPTVTTDMGESKSKTSYNAYKWTAFGLGAAALTVGTYALFARNSAATSFNEEEDAGQKLCFQSGGAVTGPGGGPPMQRCKDLESKVGTLTTLSTVGFVAGGSLVALGVVFWRLGTAQEAQSQSLSCAPKLEHLGLACAGRF